MPTAKESGGDFKPAPMGTHFGRCYGVISLGTQPPGMPNFKPTFKVLICWELSHKKMDNGDPYTINKEYTLSLNGKANLRRDLESWRGKPFTADELAGFAVEKVLNAPATIGIIHEPKKTGGVYAKVSSVSAIPDGVTVPELHHKRTLYELDFGRNDERFNALPDWIKEKISKCYEWNPAAHVASSEPEPVDEEPEVKDDLPFSFILPWLAPITAAAAGLIS